MRALGVVLVVGVVEGGALALDAVLRPFSGVAGLEAVAPGYGGPGRRACGRVWVWVWC